MNGALLDDCKWNSYVIVGDVGVFNGDVWSQWLVLDG